MHLYHDPNRHFVHTPSIVIALTFDLDLQNIGKIATNIFGTYSARWTVWYITIFIYNEDKSDVYVLLFESIRNENNAFEDVCYIIIWNLYLLYNRIISAENVFICLTI